MGKLDPAPVKPGSLFCVRHVSNSSHMARRWLQATCGHQIRDSFDELGGQMWMAPINRWLATNPFIKYAGLCLIWAEITRISEATPALRRTQRLYSKQIRRRERIFQTILLWGIELSERGDRTQQIPRWQKNSLRSLKCADNGPWNIARDTLHRDLAIRGEKGSGLFWKDSWELL